MEIDNEVRDKMLISLEGIKAKLDIRFEDAMRLMREAESVEAIMMGKKALLHGIVDTLPMGTTVCYFCVMYGTDRCGERCEYGHVHGICVDREENTSDYQKMSKAHYDLLEAITLYYKGENYDIARQQMEDEKTDPA